MYSGSSSIFDQSYQVEIYGNDVIKCYNATLLVVRVFLKVLLLMQNMMINGRDIFFLRSC